MAKKTNGEKTTGIVAAVLGIGGTILAAVLNKNNGKKAQGFMKNTNGNKGCGIMSILLIPLFFLGYGWLWGNEND